MYFLLKLFLLISSFKVFHFFNNFNMKINACFLLAKNTTKFLITGILLTDEGTTGVGNNRDKDKFILLLKKTTHTLLNRSMNVDKQTRDNETNETIKITMGTQREQREQWLADMDKMK
jgi:hypothetical protein